MSKSLLTDSHARREPPATQAQHMLGHTINFSYHKKNGRNNKNIKGARPSGGDYLSNADMIFEVRL